MFILLMIYSTVLFVFFFFFVSVFQFQKKCRVKGVSHEKKLSLNSLTLPQPGIQNDLFWDEVNASGLRPLLLTGTITTYFMSIFTLLSYLCVEICI